MKLQLSTHKNFTNGLLDLLARTLWTTLQETMVPSQGEEYYTYTH